MSHAVLNACICGGRLYHVETVRFGYVLKCEHCESESIDADYSTKAFCPECGVLVYEDEPGTDLTCEECRT